jgi:multicomponent Na+:H+ antiporter subunit G
MTIAGNILIGSGLFFVALTALGFFRLPDFFTRVHTVSKSETLGIALVLLGLILHEGVSLVALKLGLVLLFVIIANPVATHVLTRSAIRTGVRPWTRSNKGGGA